VGLSTHCGIGRTLFSKPSGLENRVLLEIAKRLAKDLTWKTGTSKLANDIYLLNASSVNDRGKTEINRKVCQGCHDFLNTCHRFLANTVFDFCVCGSFSI
jgi:hypothetical protein